MDIASSLTTAVCIAQFIAVSRAFIAARTRSIGGLSTALCYFLQPFIPMRLVLVAFEFAG